MITIETLLAVAGSTVLAILLAGAVRRRLGFVTEVESLSMSPTLAPGQRLLARRLGAAQPLRRGDVVVVDSPEIGRPIIKRVVGLPGEHVDVDAAGMVRVAGRELAEPYVVHRGGRPGTFDVPAGHLLLLGDNRAASSDARAWRAPYLPVSAVRGRVARPRRPAAPGGAGPRPSRSAAAPVGPHRTAAARRGDG